MLRDETNEEMWNQFSNAVQSNTNQAVSILVSICHRAASNMAIQTRTKKRVQCNQQPRWWNADCRESKYVKKWFIKQIQTNNINYIEDRQNYCISKKAFRVLCRKKKYLEKDKLKQKLVDSTHDVKEFWKTVKSMRDPTPAQTGILAADWVEHFKTVLKSRGEY